MDLPYTILSIWRPGREVINFFQDVKDRKISAVPGQQYITFTSSPPINDGYSKNVVTEYRGTRQLPPQFVSQSEQIKNIAESESTPIPRPTLAKKRTYTKKKNQPTKGKKKIEENIKRAKL